MTSISAWNLCVCVTVCCVSAAVVRKENLFPLDIIHYNDFHDRFEETSVEFPICSTNDTKCIGGFPRLYREIKTLLKEKPEALVLDAGDAFQGTYWFTLLKWNVTQHFINMIPNDAHTLGNHEFDNGVEGLTPYLAALHAPVVVANIDTTQEPTLKGLYKLHIIVERKGRRIGIIGVITPETQGSSRTGKVIFNDPIKSVKDEAQSLADDGVDIIIVLSHCGIKVDKQMAKIAGENVDIIVGGHSHSLLWNDKLAPSKEPIVGPYPVIVKSQDKHGHQVLVVTASAFSKYLGNITAYFNDEGDLVSFDGKPVHLDRSIPEDPEIKALMQPYTEKLHGIVNKVVGKSETDLVDIPCGAGECDIGNLVADSMLAAAKKYDPSDLPAVAFLYRSAIRGSIPTGDITRGSIINVLPFGNKLATVTIKGRYLFEALNLGLSKAWVLKPFKGPWMPQVAGMKLIANTTSQKVETVEIKHRDGFQPLKMDEDYQLTSTDFQVAVANTTLKENGRNVKFIGVDFELFEEYVTEISPVTNQLDKRLVVVT